MSARSYALHSVCPRLFFRISYHFAGTTASNPSSYPDVYGLEPPIDRMAYPLILHLLFRFFFQKMIVKSMWVTIFSLRTTMTWAKPHSSRGHCHRVWHYRTWRSGGWRNSSTSLGNLPLNVSQTEGNEYFILSSGWLFHPLILKQNA